MNLFKKIHTQLRYYLVWRTSALFVSGLVFGHNIVENAVVNLSMAYLLEAEDDNLRRSAIIINAQQGLSSILAILVAYIATKYGHFTTISVFTIPYILGLFILWSLNPGSSGVYLIAASLISVGVSTKKTTLLTFLKNQMSNNDQSSSSNINNDDDDDDDDDVEKASTIWWQAPGVIASVIVSFALGKIKSWRTIFLISAITLGCSFMFFLSGYKFYRSAKRPKSTSTNPFIPIFGVIKAAIIKRKFHYSDDPHDYFRNDDTNMLLPLTPDLFFSRWLDKAAIIDKTSPQSAEEQEKLGRLYTVTQVRETKSVMKMIPMWAAFIQFSLLKATGITFFFEQSKDLDTGDIFEYRTIITFLSISQSFSNFVASSISNLIIFKCLKNKDYRLIAIKLRIGIGLACSCLCCFVARMIEIKRFNNYVIGKDGEFVGIKMSIFWLVPEFYLLGISAGLTEEGVDKYFYSQTKTLKYYVWPVNEVVAGIGVFISIFWVLGFKRWIGGSIDYSRFDKYFRVLSIVCLINLFVIFGFTFVSKHFCVGHHGKKAKDEHVDKS